MGGLSKKAFQISSRSAQAKAPAIFVEAGNLLFRPKGSPATGDEEITAAGIMDILQLMAVDAVAVGPYDLAAGLDFLVASRRAGFPWLSANLVDRDRSPQFPPSLTLDRAGLKIGIIGLTGAGPALPQGTLLADWREVLPRQLRQLEHASDMVIVLSTLPPADNVEMVKRFPAIDILITADSSQGNVAPTLSGRTLTTQTQSQGKYLGQMVIDWRPDHPWAPDLSQEQARLRQRLGVIERSLARAQRRQDMAANGEGTQVARLHREQEEVVRQLDALLAQQEKSAGAANPDSRYTHDFIGLSVNLQNDPRVTDRINRVKASIAQNRHRLRAGGAPVCSGNCTTVGSVAK